MDKEKIKNFTGLVRRAIRERDNGECQLDKQFGIVELTGIPCSKVMTVHHKIYRSFPAGEEDGIVVCERCHDFLEMLVSIMKNIEVGDKFKDLSKTLRRWRKNTKKHIYDMESHR